MAHLNRVRAAGLWVPNSVILQAELELLDDNASKGINGDEGGTWAPSNVITIGGSGISVTGPFTAASAHVTGDVDIDGSLQVGSLSTFNDALTVFGGPVGFLDATAFNGLATFNGGILCTDSASFGGGILVGGSASFGDGLQVGGPIVLIDDAHIRHRRVPGLDVPGQTFGVDTADSVVFATLSAPRSVTASNTGAGLGSRMRFVTLSTVGSNTVTVDAASGGGVWQISGNTSGVSRTLEIEHDGTDWKFSYFGAFNP